MAYPYGNYRDDPDYPTRPKSKPWKYSPRAADGSGPLVHDEQTVRDLNWQRGGSQAALLDLLRNQEQPTSTSPSSYRSYGGGGGGGLSKSQIQAMLAALGQAKPKAMGYTPIELQQFQAPDMPSFSTAAYDQAGAGVREGIDASRQRSSGAYDQLAATLGGQVNPFTAGMTGQESPEMSAAMQRMMQAQGLDPEGIAAEQALQSMQANNAMQSVHAMLGGVENQASQSRERQLGYDREFSNSQLDEALRNLMLGITTKQAQGQSAHDQRAFEYMVQAAQRNNEIINQQRIANQQGANQTAQANTTASNAYNQSILSAILDIISQGGSAADLPANLIPA